jgi:hypothetical protein
MLYGLKVPVRGDAPGALEPGGATRRDEQAANINIKARARQIRLNCRVLLPLNRWSMVPSRFAGYHSRSGDLRQDARLTGHILTHIMRPSTSYFFSLESGLCSLIG